MKRIVNLEIELEVEPAHVEDGENIPESATVVVVKMNGAAVNCDLDMHFGKLWTIWTNNYNHSIVIDEGDM